MRSNNSNGQIHREGSEVTFVPEAVFLLMSTLPPRLELCGALFFVFEEAVRFRAGTAARVPSTGILSLSLMEEMGGIECYYKIREILFSSRNLGVDKVLSQFHSKLGAEGPILNRLLLAWLKTTRRDVANVQQHVASRAQAGQGNG